MNMIIQIKILSIDKKKKWKKINVQNKKKSNFIIFTLYIKTPHTQKIKSFTQKKKQGQIVNKSTKIHCTIRKRGYINDKLHNE